MQLIVDAAIGQWRSRLSACVVATPWGGARFDHQA